MDRRHDPSAARGGLGHHPETRPRRAHRGGPGGPGRAGGSCAVLVELGRDDDVRTLLAEHGLNANDLPALCEAHLPQLEREPADWYHRLSQRGSGDAPMQRFLAILRSADSSAHQVLERVGISTAALRKAVFEHLRDQVPPAQTTQTALGGGPLAPPRTCPGPARQSQQAQVTDPSTAVRPRRQPRPNRSPVDPGPGPHSGLQRTPGDRPEPMAGTEPSTQRAARATPQPLPGDPIDPLHGRERELATLADALMRSGVRPPLLVGERGSGRSLVARHLATVLPRPLYRLSASDYDDEDGLREDLEVVQRAHGAVIFDDLDKMASDQPPAFLPALAQAWARAMPPTLTIVSHETRAQLGAWLPGVLDGLDVVALDPAAERDVFAAVALAAPAVLAAHGVALADDTNLTDLTRAAQRYLVGVAMPGRALDLLDLACARAVREGRGAVDADTWQRVIQERTGLPRNRIAGTGDHDVLELEASLARQVVGHEHVLATLADLIRRNRAGFSSGRPIATGLLLGPSGVGKTEIAKALATALFDRDDALLRLDMSEYSEAHAVARIVGAPPGYVGHEHGGALSDPLLSQPHRVVLLDEIEKAHRDVHQLLLQVFDEGRLTDGRGRTVDFRHAVVIMTSNLGARLVEAEPIADDGTVLGEAPDEAVLDAAREAFPVELWNRIEAPLVLRPLGTDALAKICARLARRSSDRLLAERGIQYQLDDRAIRHLVALSGRDRALGARPLRHMLTRRVEALLADEILRGRLRAGARATLTYRDGEIVVSRLA